MHESDLGSPRSSNPNPGSPIARCKLVAQLLRFLICGYLHGDICSIREANGSEEVQTTIIQGGSNEGRSVPDNDPNSRIRPNLSQALFKRHSSEPPRLRSDGFSVGILESIRYAILREVDVVERVIALFSRHVFDSGKTSSGGSLRKSVSQLT